MNIYRIGAIVIALFAAVIAALLARSLVNRPVEEPKVVVQEAPKETIQKEDVLVSVGELRRGDRIIEGALKWQSVPRELITDEYILRSEDPNATGNYAGWLARTFIDKNEAVIENKLIETGAGFMASIVPKGQVAIAVGVSAVDTAGGFILPEDRVDVVFYRGDRENSSSETILTNVQVLAIGDTFRQDDSPTVTGKTATLALTRQQAELIEWADNTGEISLVLRSLTDVKGDKDDLPKIVKDPRRESVRQTNSVTIMGYGRSRDIEIGVGSGSLDRRSAQ